MFLHTVGILATDIQHKPGLLWQRSFHCSVEIALLCIIEPKLSYLFDRLCGVENNLTRSNYFLC